MASELRCAIFLDRDGVINVNRADHVKSWAEFQFLPGALWALRRLAQLACPVVVISNQGAIGRGLVSRDGVEEIHRRMVRMVTRTGGHIDAVLYCPHRPDELCTCRKPGTGLLLRAAQELGLDLARSFLVGDASTDIAAAKAVGARPILVKTGRGRGELERLGVQHFGGVHMADDLYEAAIWIAQQLDSRPLPQIGKGPGDVEHIEQQIAMNE